MFDSFPPINYIPVKSAVPGIEVYMPAPEPPEEHQEVVEFSCPQCGAARAYSVKDGGLKCAHCGFYEPPKHPLLGKGAKEFEFKVETLERSASGWGICREELSCEACGAHTILPERALTQTCPFCGSNKVIQQEAPQDALRPRFLVPFQKTPESLGQPVQTWLGSSWMVPSVLRQSAAIGKFTPIYLPYWTFDAQTQAAWRAEVGYERSESYYDASSKSWKTRTVIDWRWENGRVTREYDDLLVEGTTKVSRFLLGKVGNFKTTALVEYSPTFLAGLHALGYDVLLETAWEIARGGMREDTRDACRKDIHSHHVRNFSMQLDFANETWRYVLLPVYVNTYQFEAKTYQVLVNGQTGEIAGQRPVDWTRVWLAIAAALTPGVILGIIGLLLILLGGVGLVLGVIGFVLLLIGGGISIYLYREADAMDDA